MSTVARTIMWIGLAWWTVWLVGWADLVGCLVGWLAGPLGLGDEYHIYIICICKLHLCLLSIGVVSARTNHV
jgi:hypothetical protein